MAKKNQKLVPLTLQEIILRGDSETIRQALEARVQIDKLLEEREAAYRQISELEQNIEYIVGEEAAFPFPEPPVPVASFDVKPAPKKKPAPKIEEAVEMPESELEPETEEVSGEEETELEQDS